jgi:peptide deformylase
MNSPQPNLTAKAEPPLEVRERERQLHRLSLVYYPDLILRKVCVPVERFDSTLRDLVQEMFALMWAHSGIGLAGPQVAVEKQVLVCAIAEQQLCLTNPMLHDTAEPREFVEGCLSLPGVQVRVRRPERIRVTGYDQHGQRRSFGAAGLWARVNQHELDHLNGVLICDYNHPQDEHCLHCPLELPPVLLEERKHQSRPRSHQ